MGWDSVAAAKIGMTTEQRNLIIMLREKLDGVSQGRYADDTLPQWTKFEAMREIDKLQAKMLDHQKKHGLPFKTKCPFCSSTSRPCCALQAKIVK